MAVTAATAVAVTVTVAVAVAVWCRCEATRRALRMRMAPAAIRTVRHPPSAAVNTVAAQFLFGGGLLGGPGS